MFRFKPRARREQKGFTIVELMVVAPIVILTIGAFVTVIVSMTGDVLAARAANTTLFNVQDSLNRIEQDIKLSSSFLATSGATANNNFALTTGQGFDDGTAIFQNASASNGTMLILNSIATTGNPLAASSGYVYAIDPLNACGTAKVIQNKPQSMNIIYFVKGGTLWRRTVMQSNYNNTSTAWCNTPWQIPSCTPGYSAAFCKTQDIQLATGLGTTGFTVQYFNGSSATIENTAASNTATSDANRAAALLSSTTASVSLTSTQTVAGRSVTQSATMRATRLDVNASANVIPVTVTTPSAPVITATTSAPTTATFTWPQISGATSYSIEYSTDGGTIWTPGFNNQNTTTFSYSGAKHGQTVSVRAWAVNTTSSGYSTAYVTIPVWANLVYQNNWSDYGSPLSTGSFTKTSSGMVLLKGLVKNGTATSGLAIATLPVGYRPSEALIFQNNSNGSAGRVDVWPDGTIRFQIGSNADFGLDGISFMPSGVGTWNALTPLNGWVNATGTYSSALSYMNDSAGRVRLKGFISGGTTTSGTVIANLPAGAQPALYSHIQADIGNANGHFSINPTALVTKGYNNAWISVQGLFYPASYPTSGACTVAWCALPFVNGWKNYSSPPYASGAYTKGSDGVVQLKGLINGGSIGQVVAQLPVGYRPSQHLLISAESADAWGRVDIDATGLVIAAAGSSTWVSLDSINFLAEQ